MRQCKLVTMALGLRKVVQKFARTYKESPEGAKSKRLKELKDRLRNVVASQGVVASQANPDSVEEVAQHLPDDKPKIDWVALSEKIALRKKQQLAADNGEAKSKDNLPRPVATPARSKYALPEHVLVSLQNVEVVKPFATSGDAADEAHPPAEPETTKKNKEEYLENKKEESNQGQAQDADIRTFLGGIRPGLNPTIADMSAFKRILFEAQTLMIHNLKTVVKGEEGGIRRMAPPEREARLARQRTLLRGIDISGPLEPAHALYDLCTSMIEKNEISYISPTRCLSRQQELAGAKPDKELQLDSTKTTLVLKEQQPKMEISVASDLALYQAIQRWSLALDLTNLVSLEVMRSWTDRLFALYSQTPAPGFQKISQTQLLGADRQAFVKLGELHTGPVKPGPGPGKLLDPLVGRLEHDVSVTYFMLPLPVQSGTPGDKSDKGDNQQRERMMVRMMQVPSVLR